MNYFIDFEATQFSGEVISVGCVREDGETFYALVQPQKGKLTPFITNLTGITTDMMDEALSPNRAFEMLYDWAFVPDDTPDFYCWGDSDATFLQRTFKRMTSRKARMAAGYICGGLIDYHKKFCKSVKVKSCALIKAYNALLDKEYEQTHNALDDAMMLFEVYKAPKDSVDLGEPAKTTKSQSENSNKMKYISNSSCVFTSLGEAADWYIKNKIDPNSNPRKERIAGRIKRACDTNRSYGDMKWSYV